MQHRSLHFVKHIVRRQHTRVQGCICHLADTLPAIEFGRVLRGPWLKISCACHATAESDIRTGKARTNLCVRSSIATGSPFGLQVLSCAHQLSCHSEIFTAIHRNHAHPTPQSSCELSQAHIITITSISVLSQVINHKII